MLIDALTLWHQKSTAVDACCDAEKTECPLRFSAKNTRSNGQPLHWELITAPKVKGKVCSSITSVWISSLVYFMGPFQIGIGCPIYIIIKLF